jgi:hypothetical protein
MKEVKPVRQSDGTSIDEANSIHFDALTHPVSVRLLLLKGFQIKSQEHGFLIRINIGPENKCGIAHKDPRNCRKKRKIRPGKRRKYSGYLFCPQLST